MELKKLRTKAQIDTAGGLDFELDETEVLHAAEAELEKGKSASKVVEKLKKLYTICRKDMPDDIEQKVRRLERGIRQPNRLDSDAGQTRG